MNKPSSEIVAEARKLVLEKANSDDRYMRLAQNPHGPNLLWSIWDHWATIRGGMIELTLEWVNGCPDESALREIKAGLEQISWKGSAYIGLLHPYPRVFVTDGYLCEELREERKRLHAVQMQEVAFRREVEQAAQRLDEASWIYTLTSEDALSGLSRELFAIRRRYKKIDPVAFHRDLILYKARMAKEAFGLIEGQHSGVPCEVVTIGLRYQTRSAWRKVDCRDYGTEKPENSKK